MRTAGAREPRPRSDRRERFRRYRSATFAMDVRVANPIRRNRIGPAILRRCTRPACVDSTSIRARVADPRATAFDRSPYRPIPERRNSPSDPKGPSLGRERTSCRSAVPLWKRRRPKCPPFEHSLRSRGPSKKQRRRYPTRLQECRESRLSVTTNAATGVHGELNPFPGFRSAFPRNLAFRGARL
jgi:hypothetical protein